MDWADFELEIDPQAPVSSTIKSAAQKSRSLLGDALSAADKTVSKLITKNKKKNADDKEGGGDTKTDAQGDTKTNAKGDTKTEASAAASKDASLEDAWTFNPSKEAAAFVQAKLKPFKEYNDMYKLVTNQSPSTDSTNTLYDKLMKKEKNVLNIVNRLIEDRQTHMTFDDSFIGTPISKIPLYLVKSINGIFDDIAFTSPKTGEDWRTIFTKNKRLIYIGITLIIVAVFLLFIHSSDHHE